MKRSRPSPQKTSPKESIDSATTRILVEKGVANHCQAEYIQQVGKIVLSSNNPDFELIKPKIKIEDSKVWQQAFNFCLGYLSRNRMNITISIIKSEYHNIPRTIGFKKGKEIDQYFYNLMLVSRRLKDRSFLQDVELFSKQTNLPVPSSPKNGSPSRSSRSPKLTNSFY